jgi:hypothetical protein
MIAWSVTSLRVLPGHRLDVEFADGQRGVVDMSKDDFGDVFEPFQDEQYFAQATIRDGVAVWPNGVDVAPDAVYEEVSGRRGDRRVKKAVPQSRQDFLRDAMAALGLTREQSIVRITTQEQGGVHRRAAGAGELQLADVFSRGAVSLVAAIMARYHRNHTVQRDHFKWLLRQSRGVTPKRELNHFVKEPCCE